LSNIVHNTDLPIGQKLGTGKVRDLYELNGDLLLVTSDRISAFDVVMAEGIPGKGEVLTSVSCFWFDYLADVITNHLISADISSMTDIPAEHHAMLQGRTMRCKKAEPMPVEWVVRGYLTGSGWKDYQKSGVVSGVELPPGLQHASKFPEPILTPSTKAESGHDEPISFAQVEDLVGKELAAQGRDAALALYAKGRDYAAQRGIVIADTKFEFGMLDGEMILIDECLTPDSSRFWPADEVTPGGKPTSFDKQYLRNYLADQDWNREPPPPSLPESVIAGTAQTYQDIRSKLLS
jgi:phosphoribosylaminoimidazole-succinocarboxamide synthase